VLGVVAGLAPIAVVDLLINSASILHLMVTLVAMVVAWAIIAVWFIRWRRSRANH
jgi:hypothetical protein